MIDLDKLAQQPDATDARTSACTDYACECHGKVPVLVAEVRRLRALGLAREAEVRQYRRKNCDCDECNAEYERRKGEWV